jgi:membrane-associated phospholipid phosphatase
MKPIQMRTRVNLLFRWTLFLFVFSSFTLPAQNADISLLRNITSGRSASLTSIFKLSSNSAKIIPPAYPLFQFTLGKIKKNDTLSRDAWFSGFSMFTTGVLTYGLKESIRRPRPFVKYSGIIPLDDAGSYSFPSGHTSIAFCTATCISLYYKKWYIAVPAYAWAASVAYSRMYLGVHYPTDVIAGMILGTAIPLIIYRYKPLTKAIDRIGKKLRFIY